MKTLIICISIHHSNTEKIAKAMAGVLDTKLIKPAEILLFAQNDKKNKVDIESLSEYDLIGFGSGIYFGKHHKSLLKLVDKLPDLKGKKVFVFSTSGVSNAGNFIHNIRHKISHFHTPLREKLIKKGLVIVGEFTCKGFDTAGPFKLIGGISKNRPNKEDLKKAIDFAGELKENRGKKKIKFY